MAAPVVAGTVALMLQANPALTPNAVKAVLQYTAEQRTGYNALTQGAGFLNALGAVRLARFFAVAQPGARYPLQASWSKKIIWGSHRLSGGVLDPFANAFALGTTWGVARTNTRREHHLGHDLRGRVRQHHLGHVRIRRRHLGHRRRRQHHLGHRRAKATTSSGAPKSPTRTSSGEPTAAAPTATTSSGALKATATTSSGAPLATTTTSSGALRATTTSSGALPATTPTTSSGAPTTPTTSSGAPRPKRVAAVRHVIPRASLGLLLRDLQPVSSPG